MLVSAWYSTRTWYCALPFSGIIDSPTQSLFTYDEGKSWKDYYDPDFTPVFSPVFNNSALESSANEICKGDLFCLFDIAATKDVQIGASTFEGSVNLEMIMELSTPSTSSHAETMHNTHTYKQAV